MSGGDRPDPAETVLTLDSAFAPIARQLGVDQQGADSNLRFHTGVLPVALVLDATDARWQAYGQRWTGRVLAAAVPAERPLVKIVDLQGGVVKVRTLRTETTGGVVFFHYEQAVTAIPTPQPNGNVNAIDPANNAAPTLLAGTDPAALPAGLVFGQELPATPGARFIVLPHDSEWTIFPGQALVFTGDTVNVVMDLSFTGMRIAPLSGHSLLNDPSPGR